MHLTLLGTGCPSVDTERYGPSALVRVGEDLMAFDVEAQHIAYRGALLAIPRA